jgi:hypothetical protein
VSAISVMPGKAAGFVHSFWSCRSSSPPCAPDAGAPTAARERIRPDQS